MGCDSKFPSSSQEVEVRLYKNRALSLQRARFLYGVSFTVTQRTVLVLQQNTPHTAVAAFCKSTMNHSITHKYRKSITGIAQVLIF